MKKTRLDPNQLVVTSFEVSEEGSEKGGVHAMQIRTRYTCIKGCTLATCAVDCQTAMTSPC